jgi:hypothetical protein
MGRCVGHHKCVVIDTYLTCNALATQAREFVRPKRCPPGGSVHSVKFGGLNLRVCQEDASPTFSGVGGRVVDVTW